MEYTQQNSRMPFPETPQDVPIRGILEDAVNALQEASAQVDRLEDQILGAGPRPTIDVATKNAAHLGVKAAAHNLVDQASTLRSRLTSLGDRIG